MFEKLHLHGQIVILYFTARYPGSQLKAKILMLRKRLSRL